MLKENLKDVVKEVENVNGNVLDIKIRLVSKSQNKKTGNISQTYTTCETCPKCCPFNRNNKNNDGFGCYAASGHCRIAWDKTRQYGVSPDDFKDLLENTPHTKIIRHNVAGDLASPGTSDIDVRLISCLVDAYRGLKAYSYTHCEVNDRNIDLVKLAQDNGFIINFSCENLEQVKKCMDAGVNAVIAVNSMEKLASLQDGIVIRKCPATSGEKDRFGENMTCKECGMCWRKGRQFAIAFPAHGVKKEKIKESGKLMTIE